MEIMTLNNFITLQKVNLEKFRTHYNQGVRKFNWPINQSFKEWEKHYQKWSELWGKWLEECGEER